jgi:uncharacterized cupredoxin-like copper-binding protein
MGFLEGNRAESVGAGATGSPSSPDRSRGGDRTLIWIMARAAARQTLQAAAGRSGEASGDLTMTTIRRIAAATALAAVLGLCGQGFAAESPTTVRVALLDMSATMGMGPANQATTAPGMTMMRPGMGGGMMGGGMMGPGMMGPGMLGMMSIRVDQATAKAGAVRFDVTNWSRGMLHEMLVVAVDGDSAALPYDATQSKVAENQVKVLGDTSELMPNGSKVLDLTLPAGSYLLICNVPGHYAAGMAIPFTVIP